MNTSTTYAQLKDAYGKTYGYAAFPTALQFVMNHGCDAIRQMCRKDITDMLPDEYKSDVKDSIAYHSRVCDKDGKEVEGREN